nr:restriction endonuclease [Marinicella sp. W31]MDC2876087.1 restriction endonuclease [Marinicella sp. W31]
MRTFEGEPVKFERCAGRIAELLLGQVTQIDITRPTQDGGRDAVGKYRIGGAANGVEVEFAMEAKCYAPHVSVGVKELSRLISRLRHRQFGLLITTSFVAAQAYQEIKDDDHPIIVVSARDIAEILEQNGLAGPTELAGWLSQF